MMLDGKFDPDLSVLTGYFKPKITSDHFVLDLPEYNLSHRFGFGNKNGENPLAESPDLFPEVTNNFGCEDFFATVQKNECSFNKFQSYWEEDTVEVIKTEPLKVVTA